MSGCGEGDVQISHLNTYWWAYREGGRVATSNLPYTLHQRTVALDDRPKSDMIPLLYRTTLIIDRYYSTLLYWGDVLARNLHSNVIATG